MTISSLGSFPSNGDPDVGRLTSICSKARCHHAANLAWTEKYQNRFVLKRSGITEKPFSVVNLHRMVGRDTSPEIRICWQYRSVLWHHDFQSGHYHRSTFLQFHLVSSILPQSPYFFFGIFCLDVVFTDMNFLRFLIAQRK